jgi:hypothetical protein
VSVKVYQKAKTYLENKNNFEELREKSTFSWGAKENNKNTHKLRIISCLLSKKRKEKAERESC